MHIGSIVLAPILLMAALLEYEENITYIVKAGKEPNSLAPILKLDITS